MPTYDYHCQKCGALFEVFHSMNAAPEIECEKCGSKNVKRQIGTGGGVIFKGSGFYETDYKKKVSKETKKEEKKSPDTSSSKKSGEGCGKPGGCAT